LLVLLLAPAIRLHAEMITQRVPFVIVAGSRGLTAPRISGGRGTNEVCAADVRCSRWLGRASRASQRRTIRGAVEATRSVGSTLGLSCGWKRERGTSGRWKPSAPGPCSAFPFPAA
jgi:hypothetical protein